MRALVCVACLALVSFAPNPQIWADLPTGGVDATPAFDATAAAVCASPDTRTMRLQRGTFAFLTPPAPIACALSLIGEGKGATKLVRGYSGGRFLEWTRGTDNYGGSVRDLDIYAGEGTSGGIAILVTAISDTDLTVPSYNRYSFLIDNVAIGRSAPGPTWAVGIYLDGSQNPPGNPNSAVGVRSPYISKTSVAATTDGCVALHTVVAADLHVECYIPLGPYGAHLHFFGTSDTISVWSKTAAYAVASDASLIFLLWNGARVR